MKRFITALGIFLIASQATPQAYPVGVKRPEVVERWEKMLERADGELTAGEWKKAKKTIDAVVGEMCARIQGGTGVENLLAAATLARAVAEAGLGNEAPARWDFATAQTLVPELSKFDFRNYGETGKVLEAARIVQEPSEEPSEERETLPSASADDVQRPKKVYAPLPKYPFGKHNACVDGLIVVQAVIDAQGIPRNPKLLTRQDPLLGYAALEALREWRFEPARRGGEPLAVYYNLSVNFKLPMCLNPFARAQKGKKKGDQQ